MNSSKRSGQPVKTTNSFASSPDTPWIELRRTDGNSSTYKDHFHTALFIGAVTSGHTDVDIRGQSFRAQKGSLVIIGPRIVHRCSPILSAHSYVVAYIDADWCLSLQQEILGPSKKLILPQRPVLDDRDLFERFTQLVELLEKPGFALEKSEHLTRFIADLWSPDKASATQKTLPAPDFLAEARKLLSTSLEIQITLNTVAERIGYNPYYLLRHFKKHVGLTPHEYRLNIRIEKAKDLLRRGEPPAEVAAATGFVDQSHLNRTFRQFVSATPGEFQRRFSR